MKVSSDFDTSIIYYREIYHRAQNIYIYIYIYTYKRNV